MKRKWIYRIIVITLTITIALLSVFSVSVFSADGYSPTLYSGAGTVVDPYRISNANELAFLVKTVNQDNGWLNTQGKYFILTNNIVLNDTSAPNWTQTAKEWDYGTADEIQQSSFKGNLNGNGFVISGLYIKESAKKYNGLFPGIMGGATVENIGFKDCCIDAGGVENSEVGCIAGGQHIWPTDQVLNIKTSFVENSVDLNGKISGGFVGHIVRKTVITDCYSKLSDNASDTKGAFIGNVDKNIPLEIKSSYSTSTISITGADESSGDITYSGSYSTLESKPGLAKVTVSNFSGIKVSEKIDMLDFIGVWEAKENSTPVLSVFNKEKKPIVSWNGTVSESLFLENTEKPNSEDNPYLITNGSDLAYLANTVYSGSGPSTKDKYYKITDDIYLNDVANSDWMSNPNKWNYGIIKKDMDKTSDQTAISNASFYGHLDGNGKIIRGVYETNTAIAGSGGLFPSLGGGAVIENLGFENAYIKLSRNVGAFAGLTTNNSDSSKIIISNCYVADSVELIQTSTNASYVGGFIGRINHCVSVKNSFSSALITKTDWQRIGGIIGGAWDIPYTVEFENCYNTQANQYGVGNGGNFFIYEGTVTGSITFKNCYTTGNTNGEAGFSKIDIDKIYGSNAKLSMPGLGYSANDEFYIINGKTPQLKAFRKSVPDTEAPKFSGNITKQAASSEAIEISWNPAVDNITAREHIFYEIYYSVSPITAKNIIDLSPVGSLLCDTTFAVSGLQLGKEYYFAVKAKDASENTEIIYSSKAFATEESKNDIWDGTISKMFDGGDGTKEKPYRIANAEQLAHLVNIVNTQPADTTKDKFYELEADIYLNDVSFENWKKLNPKEWKVGISSGNVSKGFAGILDGKNHVINGIYIDKSGGNFNGLFPSLDGSAHIKNLGIINSYISSYNYDESVSRGSMSGPIAATVSKINFGGGEEVATIERCFSDETVYVQGTYCSGGIVGSVLMSGSNVKFTDCYSGAVLETDEFAGSIIGDTWDPTYTVNLEGCYGTQSGITLVGHTDTIPKYNNCYSNVVSSDGILKVYDWQLRGDDAKKNMPSFDFEKLWGTSESATPYLLDFKNSTYGVDFPIIEVSFDTNGGNPIEPMYAYTGSKLNLPTPVKEGYVFKGWYVYKELDIKYPLDTFPGYNLTLFAKWEDNSVVRQNFEFYSYEFSNFSGLGKDYEYFRPGVDNYDPVFVYGGSKSIHRLGNDSGSSLFQVFNEDAVKTLKKGENYKITFWVYLKSVADNSGKLSIISTDNLGVTKQGISMLDIQKVSSLQKGVWQKVSAEFKADGKYLAVLTSGLNELFIDDVDIIPTKNKNVSAMSLKAPVISVDGDDGSPSQSDNISTDLTDQDENSDSADQKKDGKTEKTVTVTTSPDYLWLYLSIGFAAAGLLVALAFVITLIIKKRKSKKA